MALTVAQLEVIQLAPRIAAPISIVGSLAIIGCFTFWSKFRSQAAKLICYLAISDFFAMVVKGLGRLGPEAGNASVLCQAQGAIMQWGDISSILWISVMSGNVLLVLCFKKGLSDLRRYEKWYLLGCYGVPVLFSVPPLFVRDPLMYDDTNLWCWISDHYKEMRMYLFFIPLWIIFFLNVAAFVIAGHTLWKGSSELRGASKNSLFNYRKTYAQNISIFIIAFIITWTPSTISRVFTFVTGEPSFSLSLFQSIVSPSRGLINFIAFFYMSWYRGHSDRQAATTTAMKLSLERTTIINSMPPGSSTLFHK